MRMASMKKMMPRRVSSLDECVTMSEWEFFKFELSVVVRGC